jgi:uncharacterized protein YbaP (TraB family)
MQATRKSPLNFNINSIWRYIRRCCWIFLSVVVLTAPTYAVQKANFPVFYKIEYQQQQAYLLGSLHIGRDDFYPLPHVIEQAFSQSDALVVEVDINQADTLGLLSQFGGLNSDIAHKVNQQRHDYCLSHTALCQGLAPYAPWLQSAQISMSRYGELGYNVELGVDAYFMANKADKVLLELESMQFQFELISSFSAETQLQMLDDAMNASDAEMLELVSAWRQGNAQELANIMQTQAGEADELLEKLLWQRNHTMAAKMIELLESKQHKQLFIVVGAGHIVGQQSIPSLLMQQGVKVSRCSINNC